MFPPTFKRPELEKRIAFLFAVPFIVIFPVTVAVPVPITISASLKSLAVAAIVTELQLRLPLPTPKNLSAPSVVPALIVTAPVTVNEFVPLVSTTLSAFPPLIVKEAQTAFTFKVTFTPLFIVTASAAVGTAAPPQVVVLFQLPLTLAVLCAFAIFANKQANKTSIKQLKVDDFWFSPAVFFTFKCNDCM